MYEVGHVAIDTGDVGATRAFYESVCGWHFRPWGPPGFQRAELPGGFTVAIQQRRELIPGSPGNPIGLMQHEWATWIQAASVSPPRSGPGTASGCRALAALRSHCVVRGSARNPDLLTVRVRDAAADEPDRRSDPL